MSRFWGLRRRARDERGAGMVEMALVFPLLVLLVFGVFEFGLAWRSSLTVSNALRSSARAGANTGDDPLADYYAVTSAVAAMENVDNATITKLVVFKSNTPGGGVPSQCLTASAALQGGVNTGTAASGVRCNVYEASDLVGVSESDFGTASGCVSGADLDAMWCPRDRESSQAAGADYLGVYMEVRQTFQTGLFGDGITIKDDVIMRLEPEVRT